METPKTKAVDVTEKIMKAFYDFGTPAIVKLATHEYNKVYSHVLKVLSESIKET